MLQIMIPDVEQWDEITEEFINIKGGMIQLEHSLLSLSKWEAKWNRVFLTQETKTLEETADYVRCMTLTKNIDPDLYKYLTDSVIDDVNAYIDAPMTATYFASDNKTGGTSREQVTSELIYYWMIALNIPFECQKWHLNRLLTLIKVCNIKNAPAKKSSRRELVERNRALNASRRKQLNTKG